VAARPGNVHRVLDAVAKPLHRFAVMSLIHSPPALAGPAGAGSLDGGPPDRRRLVGRLAALFFAGAGVLGLVTLPLPAPGLDVAATAAVNAVALALGIAIWFAPWERWPRRASLALVPPAFALIAMGNVFSGADLHTYGVFLWSLLYGSAWPIRRARRPPWPRWRPPPTFCRCSSCPAALGPR